MFPQDQLNFFLNVIAVDSDKGTGAYLEKLENMLDFDGSLNKELSLSKLQCIQQIYYRCPMYTQENTNSSYNFKKIICMPGFEEIYESPAALEESTKVQ